MSHVMDRPIGTPSWRTAPWTRSGLVLGPIALALFILFHFFASPERSVRMKRTGVTIATVERGVFHDFVPLRAKVVSLNSVYLDALEGGRVEKILAQAGDRVSENQPLVVLTNTELELDVLEREGRLIESITQLQSYETQLEQNRIANQKALADIEYQVTRLRRSLARRKALVSRALEPVETQESVQDELDHYLQVEPMQADSNRKQEELRVRQLPQIQGQLEKLHEDLVITHGKLDNLVVRAPIAGRLTSLDLKVGENRNRGDRFAEITSGDREQARSQRGRVLPRARAQRPGGRNGNPGYGFDHGPGGSLRLPARPTLGRRTPTRSKCWPTCHPAIAWSSRTTGMK